MMQATDFASRDDFSSLGELDLGDDPGSRFVGSVSTYMVVF